MLNDSLNGFLSGFISSIICHPLEFIKTNLQNSQNNLNNINNFKLLKKGCFISPLTYGLHYSIYYPIYKKIKNNNIDSFTAGFVAQNISNVILNPLWIIRTQRLCLDNPIKINEIRLLSGLYRNFIPNTLIGLQTGLSFYIMDTLLKNEVSEINSFILSKLLSNIITYPFDTLRTNIRLYNNDNIYQIIKKLNNSGNSKYYKGFSIHLLKSIPSFVITNYLFNSLSKN